VENIKCVSAKTTTLEQNVYRQAYYTYARRVAYPRRKLTFRSFRKAVLEVNTFAAQTASKLDL